MAFSTEGLGGRKGVNVCRAKRREKEEKEDERQKRKRKKKKKKEKGKERERGKEGKGDAKERKGKKGKERKRKGKKERKGKEGKERDAERNPRSSHALEKVLEPNMSEPRNLQVCQKHTAKGSHSFIFRPSTISSFWYALNASGLRDSFPSYLISGISFSH